MALYHYSYEHSFLKVTKEEGGGGLISFQARILRIFLRHVFKRKTLNIFLLWIRFQGNLEGFTGHIYFMGQISPRVGS